MFLTTYDHVCVSIIIPCYNGERFIAATLDSIAKLNHKNIDVILVDDGSTDNSVECAKRFLTVIPLKIVLQKNAGASSARNRGFEQSRGDFVMFLDADDIVTPNKIDDQLRLLNTRPKDWVASCSWTRFYGELPNGEEVRAQSLWQESNPLNWLCRAWRGEGMMVTGCWLIPRQVAIEAGPWIQNYRINPIDDAEYFTRILLKSAGVIHSYDSVLYYRSGITSLSQQRSNEARQATLDSYQNMRRAILSIETSEKTRKAAAANFISFIMQFYPEPMALIRIAESELAELCHDPIELLYPGKFWLFARIIGFNQTLRLRHFTRILLQQPRTSDSHSDAIKRLGPKLFRWIQRFAKRALLPVFRLTPIAFKKNHLPINVLSVETGFTPSSVKNARDYGTQVSLCKNEEK